MTTIPFEYSHNTVSQSNEAKMIGKKKKYNTVTITGDSYNRTIGWDLMGSEKIGKGILV